MIKQNNYDDFNKLKELFYHFSDKPISYFPIYAKVTGSVTAGILLSYLISLSKHNPEFCKTDKELCKETALGLYELKAAKDKLKKFKFVDIKRKGIPAKTYYQVNFDNIIDAYLKIRK